jgi:hypothetical protein
VKSPSVAAWCPCYTAKIDRIESTLGGSAFGLRDALPLHESPLTTDDTSDQPLSEEGRGFVPSVSPSPVR